METPVAFLVDRVELTVRNLYRLVGSTGEVRASRESWKGLLHDTRLFDIHTSKLLAIIQGSTRMNQSRNLRYVGV